MKSKSILLFFMLMFTGIAHAASPINMYSDIVSEWHKSVITAFDKAEKEIFDIDPTPNPDVIVPDEDPEKCPCKGTGVITHGDGHTTECPYHGNQIRPKEESESEDLPPLVKIKKTTCQCETKCGCQPCECEKTETELLLRRTEVK